ncbi:TPA: transposase [Pseudomonas aeruginosa]|nr:transposase [Pseudomonas aeruginosa]ELK7308583.1 transposase [Pseudomonas aeruginosa]ELP0276302.1 transposase [Pseudomonas aeruginosa]MBG4805705.1 transposase [Pseudomonas aeruginosa]MBG5029230.1 transposase [Pseudomonas aeruginosa]
MNSAFDLEVKAQCPNAEVVYDLFHMVAKYGWESLIGCAQMKPTGCARTNLPGAW